MQSFMKHRCRLKNIWHSSPLFGYVRRVFNVRWNRIRLYILHVEVNGVVYACTFAYTFINLTYEYIRCYFTVYQSSIINLYKIRNLRESFMKSHRLFEFHTCQLFERDKVSNRIVPVESNFFLIQTKDKSFCHAFLF